jgi:hypothetical protein
MPAMAISARLGDPDAALFGLIGRPGVALQILVSSH